MKFKLDCSFICNFRLKSGPKKVRFQDLKGPLKLIQTDFPNELSGGLLNRI